MTAAFHSAASVLVFVATGGSRRTPRVLQHFDWVGIGADESSEANWDWDHIPADRDRNPTTSGRDSQQSIARDRKGKKKRKNVKDEVLISV